MSAYFAVYALDAPGMGEVRAANRAAHRERLRVHDHPVTVRIGGPLTDGDGTMVGTLLVIEAPDRGAVERFVEGDPYVEAGLFGSIDIRPFAWGLGLPEEAAHG